MAPLGGCRSRLAAAWRRSGWVRWWSVWAIGEACLAIATLLVTRTPWLRYAGFSLDALVCLFSIFMAWWSARR